jgi:hypothetical protein
VSSSISSLLQPTDGYLRPHNCGPCTGNVITLLHLSNAGSTHRHSTYRLCFLIGSIHQTSKGLSSDTIIVSTAALAPAFLGPRTCYTASESHSRAATRLSPSHSAQITTTTETGIGLWVGPDGYGFIIADADCSAWIGWG